MITNVSRRQASGRRTRSSVETEGSKDPEEERDRESRLECRAGDRQRVAGNELPYHGQPEAGDGVRNRTGRMAVSGRSIEGAGRERRSWRGGLDTGSRSRGAKGRFEMPAS
jgi:hypothetical protein